MAQIKVVKKPSYALGSVENALQLILLLQENGRLRLSDVASTLGISASTAHRLLSTLVYKGFAVQEEDKRYAPGPALQPGRGKTAERALVRLARPVLDRLVADAAETASLVVRQGTVVQFLVSVESPQVLKVGDRAGTVLPARRSAAGQSLLAALPPNDVRHLYAGRPAGQDEHLGPVEVDAHLAELAAVRRRGHAINTGRTEHGIVGVGCAVPVQGRHPWLALVLGIPSVRADPGPHPRAVTALRTAATDLGTRLDEQGVVETD